MRELFDALPVQRSGKAIAAGFTGGDRTAKPACENKASQEYRAGRHDRPRNDVRARKIGDKLIPVVAISQSDRDTAAACDATRYREGKAENHDGLTRKRARAIGLLEGWREVTGEPVRQRVGLAGMAASYNPD